MSTQQKRMIVLAIFLGAILMLPVVASAGGQQVVTEEKKAVEGFDWRRFEGETISILVGRSPIFDDVTQHIDEFESLTGIRAIIDDIPYDQANTKKILELRQKSSTYDVATAWCHNEKRLFIENGWYEPLNRYINDPTMTNSDYDWEDFGAAGLSWVLTDDGEIYAIPGKLDLWGLFARTSILKKHGLAMPKAMDELLTDIRKVHNPPTIAGFTSRGLKGQNAMQFAWLFHAYGGEYFDTDGKLTTYGPAAVDAALAYAELMKHGPPGVTGFDWNEVRMSFAHGEAAFVAEGFGGATTWIDNPEVSEVVGDATYGFLPGQEGPVLITSMIGWFMMPYSRNKGPAWYFMQWASSKEICLRQLADMGITWTRMSIYDDPRYTSSDKFNPAWNEAVKRSLTMETIPALPQIDAVGEWRDAFGIIINEAVTNQNRDYLARRFKEETERFQAMQEK